MKLFGRSYYWWVKIEEDIEKHGNVQITHEIT